MDHSIRCLTHSWVGEEPELIAEAMMLDGRIKAEHDLDSLKDSSGLSFVWVCLL